MFGQANSSGLLRLPKKSVHYISIAQMINLLVELVIIILIFGLVSISLSGWGVATVRILNLPAKHFFDGHLVFIGLSSVLLLTDFLHWFMPVNWLMSTIICLAGLCLALTLGRTRLTNSISYITHKIKVFPLLSLTGALLVLLFATKVFDLSAHGDTGLYHLPTISWLNQHPIVAGLGNLHFRLAFNQSYFSFAALLNIYPIWNHGYAVANLYIFIVAVLTAVQCVATLQHHKTLVSVLLLTLFANVLQGPISSAPDFTIFLLQINLFLLAFQLFKNENADPAKSLASLVTLVILAITCITIKLSSLVFCVAILAVAMIKYRRLLINNNTVLIRIAIFCGTVLLNHIAISYVLSGYPLYPSSIGSGLSAFWGIPLESVIREQDWIYSWARSPDALPQAVLQDWAWLNPWLHSLPAPVWLPLLIAGLFFCGYAVRGYCKKVMPNATLELNILFIPLWAALIFWFFTAPDARFIGAVPSLILFLTAYLFITSLNIKDLALTKTAKFLLTFIGGLFLILVLMYSLHLGTGLGLVRSLRLQPLIKAIGDAGVNQQFISLAGLTLLMVCYTRVITTVKLNRLFSSTLNLVITGCWFWAAGSYMGLKLPLTSAWAITPSVETRVVTTESGLILRTPVQGDACWLTALPCTPYFDKNLKQVDIQLSHIIKFSDGFMTAQPTLGQ